MEHRTYIHGAVIACVYMGSGGEHIGLPHQTQHNIHVLLRFDMLGKCWILCFLMSAKGCLVLGSDSHFSRFSGQIP